MMAHKHLHELLKEDQEPFHLNSYIAERRSRTTTTLQVKKRKPIIETSSSSKRSSFCKHACFLSFHDSPDVRKSPFLNFPSPAMKSPCKSKTQSGPVLLHVPARTAALLLEAAMRVQKQQSSSKPKSQIINVGFGLFGSILKRLKDRSKSKKHEVRNIKSAYEVEEEARKSAYEMGLSCSCNNSRVSSAGWSESNEEKSLDLESSSSCSRSEEDSLEDDAFAASASCEKRFCSSPLSPFRFALQRTPSPGRHTPDFSSPVASPSRHKKEQKEQEGLNNIKLEDEEKEQCSPVSVLDNPFEDDDDGHEAGDEVADEDKDENDYDLECSYAIVQSAKLQLLDKLRRVEKLAELDPIELEKRMVEEMDEEDYDEDQLEEEEGRYDVSSSLYGDGGLNSFITEVLSKSSFQHSRTIPADMKRLVSDLIIEEMCEIDGFKDKEVVVRSVCKKLDSWKEVQSNTIDMMVQLDFGKEFDGWKKYQEQMGEIALEIELKILRSLLDELSRDLVN